jgi:Flp pilus assembly protein TadD
MRLQNTPNQRSLQHARLLATAGRHEEAAALYRRLFAGDPPSFELALEYWRLQSSLPAQRPTAIQRLQALDRQYPGNHELRLALADLLFAENRNREALLVLRRLAEDPAARNAAAQREYHHLAASPVSQASASAWQDFLRRYPQSPLFPEAERQLQHQRKLLADPAWQAGQRGLKLLEQGDNAAAETHLRTALRRYPNDASLHGALGYALTRQGRHEEAHAAFRQAAAVEQGTRQLSKWQDMVVSSRYWALLQQAGQAETDGDHAAAEALYRQAWRLQPNNAHALIGLGRLALAAGDEVLAEHTLLRAYALDPDNGSAIRALLRLYQDRSPEQAEDFLDRLPPAQQREHDALRLSLRRQRLERQAAAAADDGDQALATSLLSQAHDLAPDDPWLTYRLAGHLLELGQDAIADQRFERMLQHQSRNPEARYAHALYLAAAGRDAAAQASLERVPASAWSESMQALADRLHRRQLLAQAEALRAVGREPEAIALLQQEPEPFYLLQLADWASQRGDQAQAEALYRRRLQHDPNDADARLGLIETLLARGRNDQAGALLAQAPPQLPAERTNARRRLANAWAASGNREQAQALFSELLSEQHADPLLYRDAARLQRDSHPQLALDLYAQAMAAGELIAPQQADPRDNRALTQASRGQDDDGWLLRSLRSDVDTLYQRHNPTLHLLHDYAWRSDDATPGISDLTAQTTLLQLDLPLAHGHGFVRAERVHLHAGRFGTDSHRQHRREFGSCALQWRNQNTNALAPAGCIGNEQHAHGAGFALGWRDQHWTIDLGRSPHGFTVTNWLGGIAYGNKWNSLGWTLTASRRPMSNSLLSYAGTTDPRTGLRWGGVTASGLSLGLSHDQGGRHGFWGHLGQHWLHGRNVADNQRQTAMAGYYFKAINQVDERLRAGLNLMYWRHARDLGEYTLGHGGYYSPRHYLSIGVPLGYAKRTTHWSGILEGSIGWSFSSTDDSSLYPLHASSDELLHAIDPSLNPADHELIAGRLRQRGGKGSGIGIRLHAGLERRLSDLLVLGGAYPWRRSEDYAPNHALLYLRYTFQPWRGSLPLPVQSLQPYSEF